MLSWAIEPEVHGQLPLKTGQSKPAEVLKHEGSHGAIGSSRYMAAPQL
jgi:hypothetical protein